MTLTKIEAALLANTRDLLERLADVGSSELIKKSLKLNGLLRCLLKAAKEDPILTENLFTRLESALTIGREAKEEQNARKRALAREKGTENLLMAKKIKVEHPMADEESPATMAHVPEFQHQETDNDIGQPENGRSTTNAVHNVLTDACSTRSDVARQSDAANEVEEDRTSQGSRSNSRRSSTEALRSREFNGRLASAASQPSGSSSVSRETSDDDENETNTSKTITTAMTSEAPPSAEKLASMAVDPGSGESTRALDNLSSGQAIRAAVLPDANVVPNSAAHITKSRIVDKPEMTLVSKRQGQARGLESQIIQQVWPRFQIKSSIRKRQQDMEEILTMIERLNFYALQYRLTTFAERRVKTPGLMAKVSELADDSDPIAVFNAIEASSASESDAKLHRVHGQIKLVKSVREKIRKGYRPNEAKLLPGTNKSEYPKFFLSDMAEDMTKDAPQYIRDRTSNRLCREHQAGKRWMETIKTFNGEGIIFIFIFASK